jgi:L-ascorbate metabolism protein UlaG (beta-lactamase superfamily)
MGGKTDGKYHEEETIIMKITWLGHAAFLLETGGSKIVTDPYDHNDDRINYGPITMPVDIVTISHDHADHNYTKELKGNPQKVKGSGTHEVKGLTFTGIETHHDPTKGSQRGGNTIFVIGVEGMNVCHAGDLGHTLSGDTIQAIGPVDILLIPVGGFYTIDAAEATKVMEALNPALVIPMHFKTEVLDFPITGVEPFFQGKPNVRRQGSAEIQVTKETLPEKREIVILEHLL